MSLSQHEITFELPDVNKLYEDLPEEEKQQWTQLGAQRREGLWILNNKPLLPKRYLLPITRWHHERTHGGPESLALRIQRLWAAPGIYAAAKRICEGCKLCRQYASVRIKPPGGKRPPATFPFQKLQTDYADMPKTMGYSYMLVIVDQLSGWVEAFPTRYGVPEVIDSDRGSHFTAAILIQIYNSLEIFNKFHTPHHPESSSQIERMNRTLKEKLVKVYKQTGLKWPEALNLVLWDIRNTPRQPIGVSPAEILFGRILAVPGTYVPTKTSLLDGDEQVTQYLLYLQNSFFQMRNHAYWYQGISPEIQVHDIQPGDKVYIKNFKRKNRFEPKWEGPYTVLLTSFYAIKVSGKENWIHHSHARKESEA
ncbi:uncharacterized protein LOC121233150 [Aquila chrysaetos chrysaetos]|uniref:uncharacterized protein LOC121233150 n=1 Tax=Aquila chrysaetos chrysaetos TaxID=223781 RepID=UPI001B7D3062|nr:uncharacterized protein LOC121233150 [Aquila chrysaetos chrysaetos]